MAGITRGGEAELRLAYVPMDLQMRIRSVIEDLRGIDLKKEIDLSKGSMDYPKDLGLMLYSAPRLEDARKAAMRAFDRARAEACEADEGSTAIASIAVAVNDAIAAAESSGRTEAFKSVRKLSRDIMLDKLAKAGHSSPYEEAYRIGSAIGLLVSSDLLNASEVYRATVNHEMSRMRAYLQNISQVGVINNIIYGFGRAVTQLKMVPTVGDISAVPSVSAVHGGAELPEVQQSIMEKNPFLGMLRSREMELPEPDLKSVA